MIFAILTAKNILYQKRKKWASIILVSVLIFIPIKVFLSIKIVLVTPDWNDKPLEEYNKIIEEISIEKGLPFIDLYGVWKAHYNKDAVHFGQGDWLSDYPSFDACHPTTIGAKIIGDFLFEQFLIIFNL